MEKQNQNNFRKIIAWQKGKELAIFIYQITKKFPAEEKFAIVSQMRRAAYSFISNIAEGNAKRQVKDRCNFFNISQGSLNEIDCFGELAYELGYINKEEYSKLLELLNKSGYLLSQFIKSQK